MSVTVQQVIDRALDRSGLSDFNLINVPATISLISNEQRKAYLMAAQLDSEYFGKSGTTSTRTDHTASWDLDTTPGDVAVVTQARIAAYIEAMCTTAPVLSIGSTDTAIASTAFTFRVNGASYNKAAVAAGTAIGAQTVTADKWALYRLSVVVAGTITVTPAAGNVAGYTTEALAKAALPAVPANSVDMGFVTLKTKASMAWIAATDALAGGSTGNVASATNYYPAPEMTAFAVEQKINLVGFRWPDLDLAPRAYVRGRKIVSHIPAGGSSELGHDDSNMVTQLTVYYSELPPAVTSLTTTLRLPDEWQGLLVLPAARMFAVRDKHEEEVQFIELEYQGVLQTFQAAVLAYGHGVRRPLPQVPSIPLGLMQPAGK